MSLVELALDFYERYGRFPSTMELILMKEAQASIAIEYGGNDESQTAHNDD